MFEGPDMPYAIHRLADEEATIADWLARTEALHRVLRPDLPDDYPAYLRLMFAEGAQMAVLHEDGVPKALAVYRIHHTTVSGRRFYVDDLVTVEKERSKGYGAALLQWCEDVARTQGCNRFALDSGVQRTAAHRFYFRQGLAILSFGFSKPLA